MRLRDRKIAVCPLQALGEREFRVVPILFRDQPHSGVVFRLRDQVHAYLNQCVHMPRRLNCERDTIFNDDGTHLRCSMHGIVYHPESGESISTLCHGERLQRIRLSLSNDMIYLDDKRVRAQPESSTTEIHGPA